MKLGELLEKRKVEIQSKARCRGSKMRLLHWEELPSHMAKHRQQLWFNYVVRALLISQGY